MDPTIKKAPERKNMAMELWELTSLGVHQLKELQGGVNLGVRVEERGPLRSGSAWLITAFYGPAIWHTWRVGLEHGSLNLLADHPFALPEPELFRLPDRLRSQVGDHGRTWWRVLVCPALVADRALGFVVRGPRTPGSQTFMDPSERCEVVAPTHLQTRLGLADGDETTLRILPARYRPDRL